AIRRGVQDAMRNDLPTMEQLILATGKAMDVPTRSPLPYQTEKIFGELLAAQAAQGIPTTSKPHSPGRTSPVEHPGHKKASVRTVNPAGKPSPVVPPTDQDDLDCPGDCTASISEWYETRRSRRK